MRDVFNKLVKIGNRNPDLRDDISPVLRRLKEGASGSTSLKAHMNMFKVGVEEMLLEKLEANFMGDGSVKDGKVIYEVERASNNLDRIVCEVALDLSARRKPVKIDCKVVRAGAGMMSSDTDHFEFDKFTGARNIASKVAKSLHKEYVIGDRLG